MFKQPTHQQKRFETKTNVTDTMSVNFETSEHTSEKYRVSEMDSQTAGNSMHYEVSREVVDLVNAIEIKNDIANAASSLTNARFLTRNY